MRVVKNDLGKIATLETYNHYGIKVREIELAEQECAQVALSGKEFRSFLHCGGELYIYEGVGEIGLSQCQRHYNFAQVRLKELEDFLLHGKTPTSHTQQYIDFQDLSAQNLSAQRDMITPPRYSELWDLLLGNTEIEPCVLVKL